MRTPPLTDDRAAFAAELHHRGPQPPARWLRRLRRSCAARRPLERSSRGRTAGSSRPLIAAFGGLSALDGSAT